MPLIDAENFDGVTAPAIPSGWSVGSGFATTTAVSGVTPTSSPNMLENTVGLAGTYYATYGTADSNSGNVVVGSDVTLSGASGSAPRVGVTARGSAATLNSSTSTYAAWVDWHSTLVGISKIIAGTETVLFSVTPSSLGNAWYTIGFTLVGSTLSLTVQRKSDGYWLTSSGAWQSAAAMAISGSDSSITGSGYAGVYMMELGSGFTSYWDGWSFSTATTTAVLARTDANDTFAGVAGFSSLGSVAGMGRNDGFAGTGHAGAFASAAITERHDALAAWAMVSPFLQATERRDVFNASGAFYTSGTLAPTGAGDAFAATGLAMAGATAAITESHDTFTASGGFTYDTRAGLVAGGRNDTFVAIGTQSSSAALAAIAHADGFSALGVDKSLAVLAAAGTGDTMRAGLERVAYHVYANTGAGDPINYGSPIDTTGTLTFTTGPLSYPGTWSFGVRAFWVVSGLEEQNLDCAITIILDGSGIDITNRPLPPRALRAFARPAGAIRAEWVYPLTTGPKKPVGFHVYSGTTGVPNYATPAATVLFTSGVANSFVGNLAGLTNGVTYTIGVRAYNATGEETNTNTATVIADSTGPTAVQSLTATATV
jgi:hypothetical protein